MIDTDKYEQLRLDIIDEIFFSTCVENEDAWKIHLKTYNGLLAEVKRLREWENRIRTYFGDEEMMDFYDWMKEKYGEEE